MRGSRLVAALLVAIAGLAACAPRPGLVRESCAALEATLYHDGEFSFTDAEIDALRELNAVKIDAVKRYYRANCLKAKAG